MNNKLSNKKDCTGILLFLLGIVAISLLTILTLQYFKIDLIKKPIPYGVTIAILALPFIIYGLDIIKNGLIKLLTFKPTLDTLASISILSSTIYSVFNLLKIFKTNSILPLYFEIPVLIVYFIKIGRFLIKKHNPKSVLIEDKLSGMYLSFVLIIALSALVVFLELGYTLENSMVPFISVLNISCPCFIGLSHSIAKRISINNYQKSNIIISNNDALEEINKINNIIINENVINSDNTLQISKFNNYSNYQDEELLNIVASIEKLSTHNLADVFKNIEYNKEVKNFKDIPDIGISGKIDKKIIYIGNEIILSKQKIKNNYKDLTEQAKESGERVLYIIEKKKIIGIITIKELIKKDNKEIIAELIKMEKNVFLLVDKKDEKASKVAESFYIKKIITKDEIAIKDSLIVNKKSDTIEIAYNQEDNQIAVLNNNNLSLLLYLLKENKKSVRIIKQNLFMSFLFNSCLIPIAIGCLKRFNLELNIICLLSVLLISCLFTTINSLRLKR